MQMKSFDSFEEASAYIAERNRRANELLHDRQRAITFGSHYLLASYDGTATFGEVLTMEEITSEPDEDSTPEALAEHYREQDAAGRILGRQFSVLEPEGLLTMNHKINAWPIDEATFEWARECSWDPHVFPRDLATRCRTDMQDLLDHLATIQTDMQ